MDGPVLKKWKKWTLFFSSVNFIAEVYPIAHTVEKINTVLRYQNKTSRSTLTGNTTGCVCITGL